MINPVNVIAPQVLFWVFSALMLISAVGVIFARNQVYSAMNLVASFFFLAGIYALLYAHTLAVLQILVYAGAIVVLFLFVIMLLSLQDPERQPFQVTLGHVLALLAVVGVAGAGLRAVTLSSFEARVARIDTQRDPAVVTFDATPFSIGRGYAEGEGIGEVVLPNGSTIKVLGLGEAANELQVGAGVGALQPNEVVQLRWDVEHVSHSFGTVAELGTLLFNRYLLPFEATSLLLLVAIVGAVVVAKGRI